jgi:hypothetical protein
MTKFQHEEVKRIVLTCMATLSISIVIILLCAGCTSFTIPTKQGPIKYNRAMEKVYMRITDPDTGTVIFLYTNDGGSAVAKAIAEGVTQGIIKSATITAGK